MKLLFDFFPVILFFVTFKWTGHYPEQTSDLLTHWLGPAVRGGLIGPQEAPILAATAVIILATSLMVLWSKTRGRKVDTLQWVSLGIVVLLGCSSLFFHDGAFIKWKPTALYWAFSVILVISYCFLKKNPLQAMIGKHIKMPQNLWSRLLWAWASFFLMMGFLNIYVAYHFSTDTWVNFKMFGTLGSTLVFIVVQSICIAKYIEEPEAEQS